MELLKELWAALGGREGSESAEIVGAGGLPAVFAVTDLAAAAIATAGRALAELIAWRHGKAPAVSIDRRLASMWFGFSLRPIGWTLPPVWDAIAGDYETDDGWIKLHTNAPAHRAAALTVLKVAPEKAAVAGAVRKWKKDELETAIVAHGGCAAAMRSTEEWRTHPQGRAVAAEPLFHLSAPDSTSQPSWPIPRDRPLQGIRVLDLTRVLAGPVATRFLAGFGAQVLRIDPPGWDEPAVAPEVTLGKRCARLDLRDTADRTRFERLLAETDVLVHGYRSDALAGLGFDANRRRSLRPGLIDVSLDAYGWSGPWSARRGFDSLVQMSTGIAEAGMRAAGAGRPTPLPVQALDQATGYLMAAAVIRGITRRLASGEGRAARTSLARMAQVLINSPNEPDQPGLVAETTDDLHPAVEPTSWGLAQRLRPPLAIEGAAIKWELPATALGAAAPGF